ncbi:hypothetical protein [Aureispira anguillae]|uniref:Uncharacterized protein n=1 Tax=Aureispira anguillae TaxID=2864201 RepID=A0A915YJR1_9BACT|nr:hypothetical protein [Aureispira anguillae]BDS14221.1 hypothetical protein AsAng_0049990 [Aureispira anguillae]
MKNLYALNAFLGFILYLIGENLKSKQEQLVAIFFEFGYEAGPYGEPSAHFAIVAVIFCVFSILVGAKTISRLRKMGQFWMLLSTVFTLFALAMFCSPRGIALDESLWAWNLYIVAGWGWVILARKKIDHAPTLKPFYEDEILDDL